MLSIYELVTLDVQNEHDSEHDLEHKTKFSIPKLFDANGDLSKRWYVYFSYRNPETGKLQRMKNIYGKTNRYKTKEDRYSVLNLYKKRLLMFLEEGYNPFEDNTERYHSKVENLKNTQQQQKSQQQQKNQQRKEDYQRQKSRQQQENQQREENQQQLITEKTVVVAVAKEQEKINKFSAEVPKSLPIKEVFDKAIELKTNVVNKTTLSDYKSRINQLHNWLMQKQPGSTNINQVTKKMVVEFLNEIQLKTSARNRNNYRTVFSSIFQILEDNELIEKNFISVIKPLRTKPKRNKRYSIKEQKTVFKYLETNDPLLLLYIKFISYNLLRPIEVCRLKIKDINIEQRTLRFQAKNKVLKTKIIPELLFKELPDLSNMNGELLLFTPDGIGNNWDTQLINRRDYFSKRFKTVVKDHFGFNENYGLYSFRHTFITKLYRALLKESSPFEARSKLMQITGHSTMSALEKYLRDIDAELPEDYSKML